MRGETRRHVVVFAAALACLLALAAAQQGPGPTDLAIAERRAADKSLPLRDREAAADRAIEIRGQLIASAAPGDARLTGWLLDQAAATLATLGRDGADAAVLFGLPLPDQRARVQAAAADAQGLLDRAAKLTADAAAALAASGIAPDDPRASPTEQDRTVRIPFFRARAEILVAACGPDRARHAQAALDAVGKLALATSGPEAARRVNYGAALLLRRAAPAGGTPDIQAAADEFGSVIKSARSPDGGVPPMTLAEAWLGLVHAGIALGRTDATLEGLTGALAAEPFTGDRGRPDTLLAVLAADAATRSLFENAGADKSLLQRAVAQQTALLARTDLSLRAESLRPLVFEKLAGLAERYTGPPDDLPAAMRLGRAIVIARDPARRAEALAAFEAIADLPDAGPYAADALWEWAVMLTQAPQADRAARLRAAAALTRLARDYGDHPRAADAIAAALAYARALVLEPSPADAAAAAGVYSDALALVTSEYPGTPEIDLWRYERARLLTQRRPDKPQPSESDLASALEELSKIPAESPLATETDRLTERLSAAVLDDLRRQIGELRRAGDEAGVRRLAHEKAVPAARRAVAWATSRSSTLLSRFRLDLADALTDAGGAAGRPLYEDLLAPAPALPGGIPRVRLGLARALVLSGDRAGAFSHLREVATQLDSVPRPGGPPRAEAFWHAWTLMLELLVELNGDGSRTGAIRAHIKRLEGIDPDLGGPPWQTRIGAVRDGLGP